MYKERQIRTKKGSHCQFDDCGSTHLPVQFLHMRKLFAMFLAVSIAIPALPAFASSIQSGDTIKGPGDAVYYYAQNGKRYVFPNSKTYFTWYSDFSSVKTITAEELSAIQIGGNVTYKPGVRLVKITTDPRTYAVGAGGILRWIKSEEAAQTLYGATWNKQVDDIPDAYFINYGVGNAINSATDFSPSGEITKAVSINADKSLVTAPVTIPSPSATTTTPTTPVTTQVATSTSPLTLEISMAEAQANDTVGFNATFNSADTLRQIDMYFDGQFIKTCNSKSCFAEYTIPQSGTKSSYDVKAIAVTLQNGNFSATKTIKTVLSTPGMVVVTVGDAVVRTNQTASIVATIDSSIGVTRTDISIDGYEIRSCASSAHICQWADYLTGAVGSVHQVSAVAKDNLGRIYTSNTATITIGSSTP